MVNASRLRAENKDRCVLGEAIAQWAWAGDIDVNRSSLAAPPCQSQAQLWRVSPAGLTAHWQVPPPSLIVPELETELH
jgi:hypothetical protein